MAKLRQSWQDLKLLATQRVEPSWCSGIHPLRMRKALGSNPSVSICLPFPRHASGTKATAEGPRELQLLPISPHWGLNPGPSVDKTDILPLSYRGSDLQIGLALVEPSTAGNG